MSAFFVREAVSAIAWSVKTPATNISVWLSVSSVSAKTIKSASIFNILTLTVALAACAPLEQRPQEVRTQVVEVRVPIAIPCFTEAERPVLAPPTPIDIDRATVDQMAAAIAADDLADQLFAKAIDALFVLCMRRIADGTATTTVGK